jgi:diacylglycerol kinase family enzyme
VIAAGGDGTVNRVLNAILQRAPDLELALFRQHRQ